MWVAHLPSCLNGGQCLFEAVGAKQSYQTDRVVGQATAEKRGVMVQNGSPEHFFVLHLFIFLPKPLQGAENLHNYFLKVDVRCLQIVKCFCQLSYSCVGCCVNTGAE